MTCSSDNPSPTFHIRTLGCKVNHAESERIAALLHAAGWQEADAASADVRIVNTCTVTGEADAKNRKVVRQLLRAGTGPVLVTGCAVNVDADHYRDIDERVTVERDKETVPQRAAGLLARAGGRGHDTWAPATGLAAPSPRPPAHGSAKSTSRTRVELKVQDGCDNACSFCIVHTARGPARSVPVEQAVRDAQLLAPGAPELVLVGIDLAAYRDGGNRLSGLVEALLERTDVGRVRITSVEPQSVENSLVGLLARSDGRLCRHLHLCLQSGSTKVLREMNRHYSAEEFCELVDGLRAAVPGIALSTDVIVGFPGETDGDFEQTLSVVERCGFMRLHVFRYSKRPGTPAAERADQVPPQVAAERSRALQELGARLAAADRAARVGTEELVVVERSRLGTGESYHTVRFEADLLQGQLAKMRYVDVDEERGALIGEPA